MHKKKQLWGTCTEHVLSNTITLILYKITAYKQVAAAPKQVSS